MNITYESYRDIPSTAFGCLYHEVSMRKTAFYNLRNNQNRVDEEYGFICRVPPGIQSTKHFSENFSALVRGWALGEETLYALYANLTMPI